MTDHMFDKLMDLATLVVGLAVVTVGLTVPSTGPVLLPIGGTLIGIPIKRPSAVMRDRRAARKSLPSP